MAEFDPDFYGNANPPPFSGGVRDVEPTVATQQVTQGEAQAFLQDHGYTDSENNPSIFSYMRHAIAKIPEPENGLPSLSGMAKSFLTGAVGAMEGTQTGDISPKDVIALGVGMGGINIGRAALEGGLTAQGLHEATQTPGMFFANVPAREDLKQLSDWWVTARQRANNLEASGASPELIHTETSLSRDVHGNWRFEVSDKDMTINKEAFESLRRATAEGKTVTTNMGALIDHPVIQKLHPELKDTRLVVSPSPGSTGAYHNPVAKEFGLEIGTTVEDMEGSQVPLTAHTLRGVIAHELQHFVNVKDAQAGILREMGANTQSIFRDVQDTLMQLKLMGSQSKDEASRLIGKYHGVMQNLGSWLNKNPQYQGSPMDRLRAYWMYRHQAGEAEARVTEHSVNLNQEQILGAHPNSRLDIDPELQIQTPSRVQKLYPHATHRNTDPTQDNSPTRPVQDILNLIGEPTRPKTFGKRHVSELNTIEDADASHHLLKTANERHAKQLERLQAVLFDKEK